MENHSEKRRDMCRSILPSSRRKGARWDLAHAKRLHRRHVRQNLADLLLWEWEDYEGHLTDDTNRVEHGASYDLSMRWIVSSRRNSDKVGPLVRWVEAIKDDLPGKDDEAKYFALKSLLPQNLIGRHALSHVDHLFTLPSDYDRYAKYRSNETKEERAARWEREHETWVSLVRTVVETRHRELNERYAGDVCWGLHDVERWCRMHPARDHMVQVLKIATP